MKQTLKHISLYSASSGLNALIGLASLPILTHLLAPNSYGKLAMFELLVTFLVPLLLLGAQFALRREQSTQQHNASSSYLIGCYCVPALSLSLLGLLVWWQQPRLSRLFELEAIWIYAALLAAFLRCYFVLHTSRMQSCKRAMHFAILHSGYRMMLLIGMVWLMVFYGLGWQAQPIAMIALLGALFCFSLIALLREHARKVPRVSITQIKSIIRYGLPILPYSFGHYILMSSDRLLLSHYLSLEQVGVYTSSLKIAAILMLAFEGVRLVWQPWLYPKLKRYHAKDRQNIQIFFTAALISAGALALTLGLLTPVIVPLFLPDSYAQAAHYLPWLLLAAFFYMAYSLANMLLLYEPSSYVQSLLTLAIALINLAASWWLLQSMGALGVAIATAASYAIGLMMMLALIGKQYPQLFRLARTESSAHE